MCARLGQPSRVHSCLSASPRLHLPRLAVEAVVKQYSSRSPVSMFELAHTIAPRSPLVKSFFPSGLSNTYKKWPVQKIFLILAKYYKKRQDLSLAPTQFPCKQHCFQQETQGCFEKHVHMSLYIHPETTGQIPSTPAQRHNNQCQLLRFSRGKFVNWTRVFPACTKTGTDIFQKGVPSYCRIGFLQNKICPN